MGYGRTPDAVAHALIWIDDQVFELDDLIPPESGLSLRTVSTINSAGQIVGLASRDGGALVGFRLSPCGAGLGGCSELDTDGDGIFDTWETDGIPYVDSTGLEQRFKLDWNQDGESDADPFRKDIFVEIDAMNGPNLAPTLADLQRVVNAFARAPVGNPDGSTGITLHLQFSDTDIDTFDFAPVWDDFDTVKLLHFGHSTDFLGDDETVVPRLDAKREVFRYCVFGSQQGTTSFSGRGEIGGNDFMVALGHPDWGGGTSKEKAGTFMHELGHTLGLRHGGPEGELSDTELAGPDSAFNYKPNYYSIMNYQWQFPQSWQKPGSWPLHGSNPGFSVAPLRDLHESDLFEPEGLVPPEQASAYPAPGFHALYNAEPDPTAPPDVFYADIKAGAGVDFDQDGVIDDVPGGLALDVNHVESDEPASPDGMLEAHSDWAFLDYDFRDSPDFADGMHSTAEDQAEMTFEIYVAMDSAAPPACAGDVVTDGTVDVQDLLELLSTWGPCATGIACVQDLDDDGQVGVSDLLTILAAWGPCR